MQDTEDHEDGVVGTRARGLISAPRLRHDWVNTLLVEASARGGEPTYSGTFSGLEVV